MPSSGYFVQPFANFFIGQKAKFIKSNFDENHNFFKSSAYLEKKYKYKKFLKIQREI